MSILRCITFLYDYLLNSPWHRFHHLFRFLVADGAPNLKQCRLQLLQHSWVDLLYSSLHLLPHKFNDIAVWTVTWPFQAINLFLFQVLECLVGTMSWCKVVLEHKAIIPQRVSPQIEAGKPPADRCTLPCSLLSLGKRITNCPLLEMKCTPRPLRRLNA